jgi:catechol 2,3-dioxygenase-like lactoylglutathione lyase family enzyme
MIKHLDHLVLTTRNIDKCIYFYKDVLGMKLETFFGGMSKVERKALRYGKQKINLHVYGKEFEPKAKHPTPGSLDLCFISEIPLDKFIELLNEKKIKIVEGPVERTGATSTLRSIYVRDPDQNLIEISEEIKN